MARLSADPALRPLPAYPRSWPDEAKHALVERAAIYAESRYGDPARKLTPKERQWVLDDVRRSWDAWAKVYRASHR